MLTVVWRERASSLSDRVISFRTPETSRHFPLPEPPTHQTGPPRRGGLKAVEHLAPGRASGIEVATGQPADEPAIRRRHQEDIALTPK